METNSKDNSKILNSYAIWLKNQGIKSANVFTSGISKVNEEFFMPVSHKDMFEELPRAIERCEAVDWLTSLESFINLAFEKTIMRKDKDENGNAVGPIVKVLDITEKKKLENRRNCLRKFIEFVESCQENQGDDENRLSLHNSLTFLSKDDLVSIPVYNSCIAKDSDLFFLPTIIERIFRFFSRTELYAFTKKKKLYWGDDRDLTPIERYNEWRESILKKTRVYTNRNILWFDKIDGLLLDKDNGKVMVINKGHRHELISVNIEGNFTKKTKFRPKIETHKHIGEILQKHASLFPTMKMLTDIVHQIADGVELEVVDKNKKTKTIKLDEYRSEDFVHLKKYVLKNLPLYKVMVIMPHLLMELYQFNEYVSPRLIII